MKWHMGNIVQGNVKQSVDCESLYNGRMTSGGNRTEGHGRYFAPEFFFIYIIFGTQQSLLLLLGLIFCPSLL